MEEKIGPGRVHGFVATVLDKIKKFLKEKMAEPESGCGKCAVCHHVCNLLDKKKGPEK